MKLLAVMFLALIVGVQVSATIDVGTSLSNNGTGVSWHGYVPGQAAGSSLTQDVTAWAVDANSANYFSKINEYLHQDYNSTWLGRNWQYTTYTGGEGWYGHTFHYVHGNTARRMVMGALQAAPYNYPLPARCAVFAAGCGDPGTVPVPDVPRVRGLFGPLSRPEGMFLQRYRVDPFCTVCGPSDQEVDVIDVDNNIYFAMYGCLWRDGLNGSNLACTTYGAYDLDAGDLQRPWNHAPDAAAASNVSSVSGIPHAYVMARNDEYVAGVIPHALGITGLCKNNAGCSSAFTGPASFAEYESGGTHNTSYPAFGQRFRINAARYATLLSQVPTNCQVYVVALRKYGAVLLDGGAAPNFASQETGTWPADNCGIAMFGPSGNVPFDATNFEALVDPNQPKQYCINGVTGCADGTPVSGADGTNGSASVTSLTASSTSISLGQSLTLSWAVLNVKDLQGNLVTMRNISYNVTPSDGTPAKTGLQLGDGWIKTKGRAEGLIVKPYCRGTFIYQLLVFNRFGPGHATVTITVT